MDRAIDPSVVLFALLDEGCHATSRVLETSLRSLGLSMMKVGILFCLKHMPEPKTPANLSRWLFREPNTIFTQLQEMERQGLVRKAKDLDRRNMVRVALTDKGEEVYRRAQPSMKVIQGIMSCLSQEQQASLAECLDMLRRRALSELAVTKDPLSMWPQSPYYGRDESK